MQKLKWFRTALLPHRLVIVQTVLLLLCSFVIFSSQASAVIRFTDRSLFLYDVTPSATTKYKVSFTYTTQTSIGSVDMLFCMDPIPTDPCDPPAGLDVSHASLTSQSGETGYAISNQSSNHIVLSRSPQAVGNTPSVYELSGVVNPSDTSHSFSIRLSDYASQDASGSLVDLGSILSEVTTGVTLETQVPPILVFCVGQQVSLNCSNNNGNYYTDMGGLDPNSTLTATSQMAAGTNASNGYVITANGTTMEAGTHVINALSSPTTSAAGNSQFGINLRANSTPNIGSDPDGAFTNAIVMPNYDTPDEYMFQDGDEVASAPEVSLVRRFTVSYIVNSPPDLRAGVYTTTITYICSGRF